jgi:U3 small nucleolar RNA-associated protein 23
MRISKNRRGRKFMNFYRSAYGIRAPFRVLLDGTALQTAANLAVDLKTELPKVLGGPVNLFVTRAVVAELRTLGKEFKLATSMAKRMDKLSGGTSQAGGARASVLECVGAAGARLCVLTEDAKLQELLVQRRGVPVMRFTRQGAIKLEAPAERSASSAPPAPAGAPSAGAVRPKAEGDAPEDAAGQPPLRKKRRHKEPNPLSRKKKQKKAPQPPASGPHSGQSEGGAGRRKRRRRSGGGESAD